MELNEPFRIFCGHGQDDKSHQLDLIYILGLMSDYQTSNQNIETISMSQTPIQIIVRETTFK